MTLEHFIILLSTLMKFFPTTTIATTTTTTTTLHYAARMMVPLCQKQKCRKKILFSISIFVSLAVRQMYHSKTKKKNLFFFSKIYSK
jgi:hypothetical protein